MIEHVFVLVLENRSFDHLLGLSQPQATPIPPTANFSAGAPDRCPSDPVHEFDDVQHQIDGGAMGGFDDDLQRRGFVASQLPALNELASRYVLFDNWFSSVPGPTWPNRFFVHAASSGGLCTSPTGLRTAGAIILPDETFQFDNGTLFDLLDTKFPGQTNWRVYHGDVTPQVLALPGMVDKYYKGNDYFRLTYPTTARDGTINDDGFAADLNSSAGYAPKYTFIEPNYANQILNTTTFTPGDSMHPCGLASAGDQLVRYVYESLSSSPIWSSSVLLVLWDEHGGFYDHVKPPAATPPGDIEHNRAKGDVGATFAFDRLGVRVPALLIGPNAPAQALGSNLFPDQVFDHASVISTVRDIFQLGGAADPSRPRRSDVERLPDGVGANNESVLGMRAASGRPGFHEPAGGSAGRGWLHQRDGPHRDAHGQSRRAHHEPAAHRRLRPEERREFPQGAKRVPAIGRVPAGARQVHERRAGAGEGGQGQRFKSTSAPGRGKVFGYQAAGSSSRLMIVPQGRDSDRVQFEYDARQVQRTDLARLMASTGSA